MASNLVLLGRYYVNPALLDDHEYQRGDDGAVRLALEFAGGITMEVTGAAIGGVARSLGLPRSPYPMPAGAGSISGAIWCCGGVPNVLERETDEVLRDGGSP
jgi:hypothetical protein